MCVCVRALAHDATAAHVNFICDASATKTLPLLLYCFTAAYSLPLSSYFTTAAQVNFMCDAPAIKSLSFVGSNQAGEHIYRRASAAGNAGAVMQV